MTNFEHLKKRIQDMAIDEFIDFCGGKSSENIICGEISMDDALCKGRVEHDCGECIKRFLKKEIECIERYGE